MPQTLSLDRLGALLLAAFLVSGCDPTPGDQAIRQGAERWVEGLAISSPDRMARAYEEGGILLLPGEDVVVGRDRIHQRWVEVTGAYELDYTYELEGMREDGRVGYRFGSYTLSGVHRSTGESFRVEDGFMQIWRRQRDGRWLLALDMWYPRERTANGFPGGGPVP